MFPYNPIVIYKQEEIQELNGKKIIEKSLTVIGENIQNLGAIEKINGSLILENTSLESLDSLRYIEGDFRISSYHLESKLKSLGELEEIKGDAWLRFSNFKSLSKLKKVGGNLNLRDSNLTDLGNLEIVSGNLHLPKFIQNQIDLSSISVGGKIRFWKDVTKQSASPPKDILLDHIQEIPHWNPNNYINFSDFFAKPKKSDQKKGFGIKISFSSNNSQSANQEQLEFYQRFKNLFLNKEYIDLKGNNNYALVLHFDLLNDFESHNNLEILIGQYKELSKFYPITKPYIDRTIIEQYEKIGLYEKAWDKIKNSEYIGYSRIMEYEKRLGKTLFNGELLLKISGVSPLTSFGMENINSIYSTITLKIKEFESSWQKSFFEVFFINEEPYQNKNHGQSTDRSSLLSYDYEYYSQFFIDKNNYLFYFALDKEQADKSYGPIIPHVVENALVNQCRKLLREAEDDYRVSIGLPKVGEGWVSETELFYKTTESFKKHKVLHHASPVWLGRQHLDIYFPEFNIGIEYQGAQHYEAIDFFGGQDGFEATKKRDAEKKRKCEDNGCYLIYVDEGYDYQKVENQIKKEIIKRSTTTNKNYS
ncbi:MAG: hypothetical protein ABF264_07350 [Flavobacteriales bacterium]